MSDDGECTSDYVRIVASLFREWKEVSREEQYFILNGNSEITLGGMLLE